MSYGCCRGSLKFVVGESFCSISIIGLLLVSGCSGGSGADNSPTSRSGVEGGQVGGQLQGQEDGVTLSVDVSSGSGGCFLRVMNIDPTASSAQVTIDGQPLSSNLEFSFDTGYNLGTKSPVTILTRAVNTSNELDFDLPCVEGVYQTAFVNPNGGWSVSVLDTTQRPDPEKFQARFINLSTNYPALTLNVHAATSGRGVGEVLALELDRGVVSDYQTFADLSYPYVVTSQGVEVLSAVEIPCFGEESCTVTFLDSTEPGQLVSVVIADGTPAGDGGVSDRRRGGRS